MQNMAPHESAQTKVRIVETTHPHHSCKQDSFVTTTLTIFSELVNRLD